MAGSHRGRMVPAVCLAAAMVAPAQGLAQGGISLREGDRVRIHFSVPGAPSRLEAVYLETGRDSLFVRQQTSTSRGLSWSSIQGIERFDGRRGHGGGGALIGATAGLAVGILAGATAKRESQFFQINTGGVVLIATLITGAGAGLGALIGSTVRSDRWETVPVESLRSTGTD